MGRLAGRLDVDLRVVSVVRPGDDAPQPATDALLRATRAAHGTFLSDRAENPAARLAAIADATDVIAVESPRRAKRLFGGRSSFVQRLLRAGAHELLVLAPREDGGAGRTES
jgi:hypothetical protein